MDVTETLEIVTDVTMMGLLISICKLLGNYVLPQSTGPASPDRKVGPDRTQSISRPLMSAGIVFPLTLLTPHTQVWRQIVGRFPN